MNWPADTGVQPKGCDCDNCRSGDLQINPFLAPRVTHGMLLGEDDFATVIGYPRGKHQLHQAWLHGAGVVWGYPVSVSGLWELKVGPGLAIDCLGREIVLTGHRTLDLRELVDSADKAGKLDKAGKPDKAGSKKPTKTIHACVVAEFEGCRTAPVPVVADPCDVNRTHDDYSRVVEQAHIDVRYGPCAQREAGRYHRVRVLLGLDTVGDVDKPGLEALQARESVLKATDRAVELEHQLWEMACRDGIDLHPTRVDECAYGWFPCEEKEEEEEEEEEDAAVVLAEVKIILERRDDVWAFAEKPAVEPCVRATLLPTDVITSLTAGLAPGLLGPPGVPEHGPQVYAEKLRLEDDRQKLIIPVISSLVPGTVPDSVEITTLTREGSDRWVVEDIYHTSYDAAEKAIVVRLAYSLDERPAKALVRVRVRGTGSKPVMGEDPLLPLAGVYGRAAGDAQDGHDAVWTFTNDLGRAEAGPTQAEPPQSATADQADSTAKEAAE
jgi:hypothetical protein